MTTVGWIDAGNGAAGDMLLAALVDAGADRALVLDGLGRLPVEPVRVAFRETRRHGLRALHAGVEVPESRHRRTLTDVLALLDPAPAPAADFARRVFLRLAGAEAAVHGIEPAQVHFHEVGALDAIVDVLGCALALHSLGLLEAEVVVSPVAVGSGTVGTAHGPLPVPPPAVLRLLAEAGMPTAAHAGAGELCTPTGAALLATLATGFGPLPAGTPRRIGVGAGRRDPATHANVLRVVLTDGAAGADPPRGDDLLVLETTVDDLDPRLWPEVLATMREVGAADAWCTPVLMRKGRPGHVLTVLAAPAVADAVSTAIFRHTSALGVRSHPTRRLALPRDRVVVDYHGRPVGVKRGLLGAEVVTVQPEYDEARTAATTTGRPLRQVLDEVRAAARRARVASRGGPGAKGSESSDAVPPPEGEIPEDDRQHERRADVPGVPEHRHERHPDHHRDEHDQGDRAGQLATGEPEAG
ncbi:nickel pincer cofactor biosynthesis protein LarC [Plantactinospora sp. WMMB334]|uniref:nickel pincer cofactor biosynthesis protein LarC n=1 Tax=Plantactinospora sp. WMMB334 TaxID=3404119 RepID=UPI003B944246